MTIEEWRTALNDPFADKEELTDAAADWGQCPVGQVPGISRTIVYSPNDRTLHELAINFEKQVEAGRYRAALKTIVLIELRAKELRTR